MESVHWVMPQKKFDADALGVVTICLVAILVLICVICIVYSFYFRSRVHNQGFVQLGYFSGPWIIRIAFIVFAIWWGVGEIIRLNFIRREGRALNANYKWQKTVCKCYIVSNLGMAEPCLFLTLVFLLRASLKETESGTLNQKWNYKTAGYILLFCFPVFILQLMVILIGPKFNKGGSYKRHLPHYFTNTVGATKQADDDTALCTFPLLSTIFLGIFAMMITTYLFLLGRRILYLVINKGLQRRVYTLIISVASFFPLRVLLLGLSVLSKPEHFWFEALAFLAFLSFLCCAGVGVFLLVYFPIADSLALKNLQDLEAMRRISDEYADTISLLANRTTIEEIDAGSSSGTSNKRESALFGTMDNYESMGRFVELSLFSASQHSSPPGSPQLLR